jgi:hypothetical protein
VYITGKQTRDILSVTWDSYTNVGGLWQADEIPGNTSGGPRLLSMPAS